MIHVFDLKPVNAENGTDLLSLEGLCISFTLYTYLQN